MTNKFIISTDNCADYFKSDMQKLGIYFLPLKRILGDKEFAEIYDSHKEFDAFYEEIKKGALPSTSQLNPNELITHFKEILAKDKEGDIIHISLSSGVSGSHASAQAAANELNPTLKGRKIYAFDSLTCTGAQMMLIDKFLELRPNTAAEKAVKIMEEIRDNQHLFFMADDLFHLKRGGRVGAAKAVIGSLLGVKPILVFNKHGKLAVIDKTRGGKAAAWYLNAIAKYAASPNEDFAGKTIQAIRTSQSETYTHILGALKEKYPKAIIKESRVGPIIGSHVGSGAFGFCFIGKPRLDV